MQYRSSNFVCFDNFCSVIKYFLFVTIKNYIIYSVKSPVDLNDMKGVPSIRVHNGKDYYCNNGSKLIRWTEVFILKVNV